MYKITVILRLFLSISETSTNIPDIHTYDNTKDAKPTNLSQTPKHNQTHQYQHVELIQQRHSQG